MATPTNDPRTFCSLEVHSKGYKYQGHHEFIPRYFLCGPITVIWPAGKKGGSCPTWTEIQLFYYRIGFFIYTVIRILTQVIGLNLS